MTRICLVLEVCPRTRLPRKSQHGRRILWPFRQYWCSFATFDSGRRRRRRTSSSLLRRVVLRWKRIVSARDNTLDCSLFCLSKTSQPVLLPQHLFIRSCVCTASCCTNSIATENLQPVCLFVCRLLVMRLACVCVCVTVINDLRIR